MNSLELLYKKSLITLKHEGMGGFVTKSARFVKKKLGGNQKFAKPCYKDILFINGCSLPHPSRYRVDHQIEQLHFNGYSCDSVFYEDLTLEMLKYYRAFIFFRCPFTDLIGEFVSKAKYFNKRVFFDIDDLVIDYKYVKEIKYLETMSKSEFDLYMDGVNRHKKTLELCDYAITTTERLANELNKYVSEVYINRNVASEKMVEISQKVLKSKVIDKDNGDKIILGYFSGSITHNDDFEMILPVLRKVFSKYSNVYLKVVGILDIPKELMEYKERIIAEKFLKWGELPKAISTVDINLAPLTKGIFNEAKSENKWVEAALVKVPTIASEIGAFKEMVTHEVNGILVDSLDDWEKYLVKLIENEKYRADMANNAYEHVMKNCITAYTGFGLFNFIESKLNDNIVFVLPSTQISGGVNVIIKHCNILRDIGNDVTILTMGGEHENFIDQNGEINVVPVDHTSFHAFFRKGVATLWSTLDFINNYPKIRERYYLVQNFETDFYEHGHAFKIWANLTYNAFYNLNYITISKWCENWLKSNFNKNCNYAPNGIDLSLFKFVERNFNGKIRILVEGNSDDYYKNVDESFKITNSLDRDKYEIWYLSYNGKPKDWYKVDKFLHKIPYSQVAKVYQQCHILIKSSLLESFSYPPLEMMATGGIAVVSPNAGNIEYLKDRENCLFYEQGNIENAINLVQEICEDKQLRDFIIKNGVETAKERDWSIIKDRVVTLYENH